MWYRKDDLMKKYVKKLIPVVAVELIDENYDDLKEICGDRIKFSTITEPDSKGALRTKMTGATIETLEGKMKCITGDYIIQGIHGEVYPCARDIFLESYDEYKE